MDQLICASLSHTNYWFEVGMLKVPALCNIYMYCHTCSKSVDQPGKVTNPAHILIDSNSLYTNVLICYELPLLTFAYTHGRLFAFDFEFSYDLLDNNNTE